MEKKKLLEEKTLTKILIPYIDVPGYDKFAIIKMKDYFLLSESMVLDLLDNDTDVSYNKSSSLKDLSLNYMVDYIVPYMDIICTDCKFRLKEFINGSTFHDYLGLQLGYGIMDDFDSIRLGNKSSWFRAHLIFYMAELFGIMKKEDINLFIKALDNIKFKELHINRSISAEFI